VGVGEFCPDTAREDNVRLYNVAGAIGITDEFRDKLMDGWDGKTWRDYTLRLATDPRFRKRAHEARSARFRGENQPRPDPYADGWDPELARRTH
jgi:hypothetical protein